MCFNVTDLDGVLHIFIGVAIDSTEKIHAKLWNDAFLAFFLFAHHRKRFSGSRLAVGKDANVVTFFIIEIQCLHFKSKCIK